MRRVGRVRSAVAGLVALAALAGCSGGGQASETLPSTSRTAASSSPSLPPLGPADFPVPIEARQRTEAGAIAAGKYFIQLTVRAYQSGDAEVLPPLSQACEFCETLAHTISEDAAAGLRVAGGDVTFEDSGQVTLSADSAEVAFTVSQSPLQVIDATGAPKPDRAQPAFQAFTSLALNWDGRQEAWLVNQVTNS